LDNIAVRLEDRIVDALRPRKRKEMNVPLSLFLFWIGPVIFIVAWLLVFGRV
jgi:hypothetical protein